MSSLERILKPSFWALYAIIVFEILFMISPFALYFYSVYGPVLDFFNQWAGQPGSPSSFAVIALCLNPGFRGKSR